MLVPELVAGSVTTVLSSVDGSAGGTRLELVEESIELLGSIVSDESRSVTELAEGCRSVATVETAMLDDGEDASKLRSVEDDAKLDNPLEMMLIDDWLCTELVSELTIVVVEVEAPDTSEAEARLYEDDKVDMPSSAEVEDKITEVLASSTILIDVDEVSVLADADNVAAEDD